MSLDYQEYASVAFVQNLPQHTTKSTSTTIFI